MSTDNSSKSTAFDFGLRLFRRDNIKSTTSGVHIRRPLPFIRTSPSLPYSDIMSVPDGNFNVGGINDSNYARKRRELMTLGRDLQALGASDILEIPRIAVIGAQSAGKSSLVEAVTGIKVPRDSGTCTRCPMECTILAPPQSRWSCNISLRFKGETQKSFSPELTSKDDVEIWLWRAQAAVLCPHLPLETFKTKNVQELKALTDADADAKVQKFTKDSVVIDIVDPDGADLVFIDLPGLVQTADRAFVTDVVQDSISHESTIILVTMPASDDMENQQALTLAKEVDPAGERTIVVVTKPDTLSTGDSSRRKMWQEIFDGEDKKYLLRHGYYCVRLPSDDERIRNIPRSQTRRSAMTWFANNVPWNNLRVRNDRLGVDNVVHNLSGLLMRVLLEAIPKLIDRLNKLLDDCLSELGQLPPELVTTDATTAVVQLVSQYCKDVQDVVYGRSADKSFVHRSREAYRWLMFDLRRTAPDFRPSDSEQQRYHKLAEPFVQMREDEAIAKDRRFTNATIPDEEEEGEEEEEEIMDVQYVRNVIRLTTGWELPHNVPYQAKVQLIKGFVDRWSAPSAKCFNRIKKVVQEIISEMVSTHFGRFPALKNHLTPHVHAKMEELVFHSTKALEDVLQREQMPFWTQNDYYLEQTRSHWLSHYKLARNRSDESLIDTASSRSTLNPRHYEYADLLSAGLSSLRSLGYMNVTAGDLPRLLRPDEFEEELEVMASVRGYFQVAYKRVIDNVPMTIQYNFVEGFGNSLEAHLFAGLEIGMPNASQRLKELLAEDPELALNRSRLTSERMKLEDIKARLETFRA